MPDDAPRDIPRPPPPVAAGPTLPEQKSGTRRNLVLAACLMATFMAAVESSIVATAIPTLVGDLGGFNLFSWVFTIYLLTQAVSIPVYGRLADLFGRKRIFYIGAGVFLLGSTLCGFAWSMPVMIGFRALQGFGAGGVQPIASTILGDIYAPAERAKVQGLVSSVFGVSAVAGPSLGAFLITHLSWQAVFWVNIPVGAMAIGMIAVLLREDIHKRSHRIDWLGSLLLLASVGLLMIALVQGGTLATPVLAGLVAAGVASLAALYWHERRTKEPMLPLELWRIRLIAVGSLGNGTAGAVTMGMAAFLPTYIQGAMGDTPLMAGTVLGAMSVAWALLSVVGGRLMVRTSYRLVAVLGAMGLCAGSGMLQTIGPADGPWPAALAAFIIGGGMGFCSTSFIVSVQTSVPWHQRGAATSSTMFMRFIGQSVGTAGCAAVLNLSLRRMDPSSVDQVRLLLEPAARSALPPDRLAHLVSIVATGLHHAYLLTLAAAIGTLCFASLVPKGVSPRG
ncbi:MAG TPA: MDR family MFS transporter [Rhodopila sp.]|uniref:MDR family MFS transporter n=1 Tax=Rhodopila sp. TaxID=2480087 RepID=UPI002C249CD7|nr:MDR family MFS transporter [Rhodopila sp.]HVY14522.1 MDR family MFS transporter [Rhodopila sp.]